MVQPVFLQCAKSVSKAGYKAHLKACSMNKGIPCPECGSIHRHPQLLAKHIQKQHTFVTCEICGKEVKTGKLSYHMGQYHTADEDMQHRYGHKRIFLLIVHLALGFKIRSRTDF